MPRLFVALALPEAARVSLAGLCGGVPGARWTLVEQFHLTLRFIGDVDGTTADDVVEVLDMVMGAPFDLTLKGVGNFDKGTKPTALWVGVADKKPLARLNTAITRMLAAAGIMPETRKYHPHVSLARLKGAYRDRVAAFLAAHGDFALAPIRIDAFHLFSSHRGSDGAHYRIECSYPLTLAPTPPRVV